MKKQGKSIKKILKKLINLDRKTYWLNEWEVITSSSLKKIQLVKKHNVIIEATIVRENNKVYKLYRLKETPENMERAKALLKALS